MYSTTVVTMRCSTSTPKCKRFNYSAKLSVDECRVVDTMANRSTYEDTHCHRNCFVNVCLSKRFVGDSCRSCADLTRVNSVKTLHTSSSFHKQLTANRTVRSQAGRSCEQALNHLLARRRRMRGNRIAGARRRSGPLGLMLIDLQPERLRYSRSSQLLPHDIDCHYCSLTQPQHTPL